MTNKVYTVTDLGPGDGGKGGVVHKIATMMRAHTVIKVGGAQGSHGVRTSRGESFAFSQWGCGTFEGIKTHISSQMIVSPEGLLNEAAALRYEHGIHNVFDLLTIDETALCATPYHGIASKLKEMARGKNPRGTIGTGVGEAYRYSESYPDLTIRASDLSRPGLQEKLFQVRQRIILDLQPLIAGEFLPDDRGLVSAEVALLNDNDFLTYVIRRFQEAANLARIVDHDYLEKKVLAQEGVAVIEKSHGVLTDHYNGFHPHTSAIRTLPRFTHALLQEAGYNGEIVNIGVFRAYAIRHGAGPLPTADPQMTEKLLPGSHKENNRYQGEIRVGPLDLVLLRYAIGVCGGPSAFNGLAVTWFDQILANGEWHLCDGYLDSGEILIRHGDDQEQLEYQERLTKQLFYCQPEITTLSVPLKATRNDLYHFCADILQEKLGASVRMISFGPTEQDKVCK
jgi:adenylosuccinate synthase